MVVTQLLILFPNSSSFRLYHLQTYVDTYIVKVHSMRMRSQSCQVQAYVHCCKA